MRLRDDRLRYLLDRVAIEELLHAYAVSMDTQDWKLLESVFAEEVTLSDGLAMPRGVAVAELTDGVSHHFSSHHQVSGHRIRIEGDSARSVTYLHSIHLDDPQDAHAHADHGGWYLARLRRTRDGWKIHWLKHVVHWRASAYAPGALNRYDIDEVRDHLS